MVYLVKNVLGLGGINGEDIKPTIDQQDEYKANHRRDAKICNFIAKQSILLNKILIFLSDPGPIIVYPCQSLTHWLTHSLTDDLVENWMNWPKYADYADHADYADRADYADNADHADYADYAEWAEYAENAE